MKYMNGKDLKELLLGLSGGDGIMVDGYEWLSLEEDGFEVLREDRQSTKQSFVERDELDDEFDDDETYEVVE